LPSAYIENRGVPGYGIAQMYLHLQQSVERGDTPTIVVINYADFHDWRVPQSKMWSNMITQGIAGSNTDKYNKLALPYYYLDKGQLIQNKTRFGELKPFWKLSNYSSIAIFVNLMYDYYCDRKAKKDFHDTSHQLILQIMDYCRKRGITPILAGMEDSSTDPQTNDIQTDLRTKGFYTLNYGIDIADNKYNCGPYDTGHPNPLAHSIFAKKLYDFMIKKKIVNSN
jgi:hypothetical protein